MNKLILILAVAGLAGCASGVRTKTELAAGKHAAVTSRTGPVCLLAGDLPEGVHFTLIGRVKATKGTYGGVDNLMRPMADEARRVGADAITHLQADQRFKGPLPWRYNAPTGDGPAVKLEDSTAFDCAQAGGQLL
jgi:uncharacterized protein YbjQ (UPF0145 family)